LVLVLFTEDKTVVPKESAWFGSFATEKKDARGGVGVQEREIIPMRLQPVYVEDTFGLRTLDERGGVKLVACEAEHMRLSEECWKPLVRKYTGGEL
jgi:palmitoyl-protein thioesterase